MSTSNEARDSGTELYVGYAPAFRGMSHWNRAYRKDRTLSDGHIFRRVMMENTADRHERVVVDVTETATEDAARAALRALVADSNVELTNGPERLGPGARQFPENDPHMSYFRRANLVIWVFSCGRHQRSVQPWVDLITADL